MPPRLSLMAGPAAPAFAEAYPSKPIRLLAPGAPGSPTDIRGRWLAHKLGAALGRAVVMDNRPGAGGGIATEAGAKSAPDGYTLLVVHQGTLALNPHMYARLGYDPITDFAPISRVGMTPLVLAVPPGFPVNSVAGLVQYAKQRPGQLDYGSPGSGTPSHVAGELFKRMAGIDVLHVPYKGSSPVLIDLIAGRLTYTLDAAAALMPSVQAGKLKALGVTSAKRTAALSGLPTLAESGVPGYEYWAWQGIVAPAGTPREIVNRLNAEIVKILNTPEAREWFAEQGGEPVSDTPAGFAAYIRAEHAKWGPVIREAGIKAD
ncbi:MAG TPA: tripartite tricarboxylate transporter substrate binding protein [Burkholderiales bacterium]|nr:tripartite tricarboxylate transporter substrate binding protein [Burkholderiales bacterium]